MSTEADNEEPTTGSTLRRRIAVASATLALGLSGVAWAGCGDDEDSSAATDATDAAKSDATDATDEAKSDATDAVESGETDATDAVKDAE